MTEVKLLGFNKLSLDGGNAEELGGKALGLQRLRALNISVPQFYVFKVAKPPVRLLNCDDLVTYANLYKRTYAVRSGAPVSMPGMLKTVIPVQGWENIEKAIHEVYESWNSPAAVAYRENNGIADTGTAVIVQRVPNDIRYSGVAFTADPDDASGDYAPIVECVEGLGEALVDGEKKGKRIEEIGLPGSDLILFYQWLEKIHTKYGPSDVEWCACNTLGAWSFYFLQHRTLKLAAVEPPEDLPEGAQLITRYTPIGAPVRVVVNDQAEVFWVETFRPDEYKNMIRSKVVFTTTGSKTCHAAIVARNANPPKPALVTRGEAPIGEAFPWLIDGKTGCIYKIPFSLLPEETVVGKTRVPRLPGYRKFVMSCINVNVLCLETYQAIHREDKEKLAEIAEVFSGYLYCAVLGEIRHFRSKTAYSETKKRILKRLEKVLGGLPWYENRVSFLKIAVKPPEDVKETIRLLGWILAAFRCCSWCKSSFGGQRWAQITQHLLLYVAGVYDDILFIDGLFNLQHNSSFVFDKYGNVACSNKVLLEQLDAKRYTGLNKLETVTEYWMREIHGGSKQIGIRPLLDSFIEKHWVLQEEKEKAEALAAAEEDDEEEEQASEETEEDGPEDYEGTFPPPSKNIVVESVVTASGSFKYQVSDAVTKWALTGATINDTKAMEETTETLESKGGRENVVGG